MDPDSEPDPDAEPDPAIFVMDLQDASKKFKKKRFFCLLLFEGTKKIDFALSLPSNACRRQCHKIFIYFVHTDLHVLDLIDSKRDMRIQDFSGQKKLTREKGKILYLEGLHYGTSHSRESLYLF
jgi:hypothetical protein